jgi:hypothetical protein
VINKLNKKQMAVIYCGIIALFISTTWPPYYVVFQDSSDEINKSKRSVGHHLIFDNSFPTYGYLDLKNPNNHMVVIEIPPERIKDVVWDDELPFYKRAYNRVIDFYSFNNLAAANTPTAPFFIKEYHVDAGILFLQYILIALSATFFILFFRSKLATPKT